MTGTGDAKHARLIDETTIPEVIREMTLREKASLVAGVHPFETYPIERHPIARLRARR